MFLYFFCRHERSLTSVQFDLNSITEKMADMEGDDEVPKIKLGDASCAAPFTSKLGHVAASTSSPSCVFAMS